MDPYGKKGELAKILLGAKWHKSNIPTKQGYIVIYHSLRITSYLSIIMAGKMKPISTAAVAPVNWNASQMLGTNMAAR